MRFAVNIIILLLTCNTLLAQRMPELIPYMGKEGWGYCSEKGEIIIRPQFRAASLFVDGRAIVTLRENGTERKCLIDESGNYVIPREYNWSGYITKTMDQATLNAHNDNDKWGIVDMNGKWTIPCIYDRPTVKASPRPNFFAPLKNNLVYAIFSKDGKYGIVDTLNNEILSFSYTTILGADDDDSLRGWVASKDSLFGAVGFHDEILFPFKYYALFPIYDRGLAIAIKNNKKGVVDSGGKVIIPFIYDDIEYQRNELHEGFLVMNVPQYGKMLYGWCDIRGRQIIKPIYSNISPTGKYWLAYPYSSETITRKMALLDLKGKTLIPPTYDMLNCSGDTIFRTTSLPTADADIHRWTTVRLDNKTFKPIGKPDLHEFSTKQPWICGTAMMERGRYTNNTPFIDSGGNKVYSFINDRREWQVTAYIRIAKTEDLAITQSNSFYAVRTYGGGDIQYAVVDTNKRFIIKPQSKYEFKNGFWKNNWLIVRQDSSYAVVDTQLNVVVPFVKRQIDQYFTWKGKQYTIGPYNRYRETKTWVDQWERDEDENCFQCKCNTMLDKNGGIAKGFENLCVLYYFFKENDQPILLPEEDVIHVYDSSKRRGLMHFDGTIVAPAISFKYNKLIHIAPNIFVAENFNPTTRIIINKNNENYLPKMKVSYISQANTHSAGLLTTDYLTYSDLYSVTTENHGTFFMNKNGMVYADPEFAK